MLWYNYVGNSNYVIIYFQEFKIWEQTSCLFLISLNLFYLCIINMSTCFQKVWDELIKLGIPWVFLFKLCFNTHGPTTLQKITNCMKYPFKIT